MHMRFGLQQMILDEKRQFWDCIWGGDDVFGDKFQRGDLKMVCSKWINNRFYLMTIYSVQ